MAYKEVSFMADINSTENSINNTNSTKNKNSINTTNNLDTVEEYGNDSIDLLEGARRVRFRPAAVLGSNGLDGARHTVYEIVGNATDEQMSGYGDKLEICYYEDGSISVRDYGRGVPLGWNSKKNAWNYFLIYEEMYAGGKYSDSQKVLRDIESRNAWDTFNLYDHPYLITVGLNGLGAAATQFTSEYCTVSSIRGGIKSTMKYEKGVHILDKLIEEETDEENGTFVHWKPDAEVFTDVNLGSKWVDKLCKSLSYVAGFDVTFNNKGKITEYKRSTIEEQMKKETGECMFTNTFHHEVDGSGDVCICYTDVAIGLGGRGSDFFNNKVEVRGGVHADAVNTSYANFFEARAKERGLRIKSSDYAGKLSVIVSTLSNKVSYRGQTKDSMDDAYIFRAILSTIDEKLNLEWDKGTDWLVDVVDEVIQEAENRIKIQELSKNIKETEKAIKSNKVSGKFKSCEMYDKKKYDQVEFWIFEGDSAGNSGKNARDSRYQCLMPIRGKSLNVFKAPVNKIIENKEIRDIAAVLGCGIDMGIDGVETFDRSKLKVGKIIIGADADIDGSHIRTLLFLIFYKLFPELLYEGLVYVADTPRFVISTKNDEQIYCLDDEDLRKKREEVGEYNIHEVTRFKGLGEMNKDQLWDTTMNPKTRRLTQIKIEKNDSEIYDVLEAFFGKNTDRRKRAILGSMMGEEFDTIMDNIEEMVDYINSLDLSSVDIEDVVL